MYDEDFVELPELPRVKKLTKRELQVLRCMASGMTAKEMGMYLSISEKTCETHTHNIRNKMMAKSSAQAVSVAYKEGILR